MLVAVLLEHDLEHLLARLGAALLAARGAFGKVHAVGDALALVVGGFGLECRPAAARVLGGGLDGGGRQVDEPGAGLGGLLAARRRAEQRVAAVHAGAEVGGRHCVWFWVLLYAVLCAG